MLTDMSFSPSALGAALLVRALGGKGSGDFGHAGRPGAVGGSGEGGGGQKVRNEKSLRALKAFVPIHAEAQRHAEANEVSIRRMVTAPGWKATRTDDNLPVDVIIKLPDGRVAGIEVKTIINGKNDKITMRTAAIDKKDKWSKSNHASVHTVVVDDRERLGNGNYSGHRLYYRRGTGSFRVGAMIPVRNAAHLKELLSQ